MVLYRRVKNKSRHLRRSTYPAQSVKVKQAPPFTLPAKSKVEPLPPPLFGCSCSECNAQQSLGALTLNRELCQHQTASQVTKWVNNDWRQKCHVIRHSILWIHILIWNFFTPLYIQKWAADFVVRQSGTKGREAGNSVLHWQVGFWRCWPHLHWHTPRLAW